MSALAAYAYRALTTLLGAVDPLVLGWRGEKEDRSRRPERRGQAQRPRPEGQLVWLHGASVGETLSALPLIECLLGLNPQLSVIVTSGTRTSAELLSKRLPPRAFHQYVPLDVPRYAKRFLRHWRPDAVLWLESDLWPNLLAEVKKAAVPAALLNARLSERSTEKWLRHAPRWIGTILSTFWLALAQTEAEAERLKRLGLLNTAYAGNLKYTAPSPTFDAAERDRLQAQIGDRPLWLMAQTHEGEEEIAARLHTQLSARWPQLLTLIVPRHPARAEAVATQLAQSGLTVSRRSFGQPIQAGTAIYLGDTLGEMGLFYRLSPITFVAGSFARKGGHNPIEAAQCGTALLCGPDMRNIITVTHDLQQAGALIQAQTEDELSDTLALLLADPARVEAMRQAGLSATARQSETLQSVLTALTPFLAQAGLRAT